MMSKRIGSAGVRGIPWLLAIAGLVIPLVGGGFATWWLVLAWFAVLGVAWSVGGALLPTRRGRVVAAIAVLPLLSIPAAWVGGWWLIPAVLAWLALEAVAGPGPRVRQATSRAPAAR